MDPSALFRSFVASTLEKERPATPAPAQLPGRPAQAKGAEKGPRGAAAAAAVVTGRVEPSPNPPAKGKTGKAKRRSIAGPAPGTAPPTPASAPEGAAGKTATTKKKKTKKGQAADEGEGEGEGEGPPGGDSAPKKGSSKERRQRKKEQKRRREARGDGEAERKWQERQRRDAFCTVRVGNLPRLVKPLHVRELFSKLGPDAVTTVRVCKDETGKCRGHADVRFQSPELAKVAARLPAPKFEGRRIVFQYRGQTETCKKATDLLRAMYEKREVMGREAAREAVMYGRGLTPVKFEESFLLAHPVVKAVPGVVDAGRHSAAAVKLFREENQIRVQNCDPVPDPALSFDDVHFGPKVMEELLEDFEKPTPVQAQAWPLIVSGRDCIIIAETGSGKTLAYVLPALAHVTASTDRGGDPAVLVAAPTRELVQQITRQFLSLQAAAGVRVGTAFGGSEGIAAPHVQGAVLVQGVDVVVAVPGRLIDFVEAGIVSLRRVTYFVLDECDHMLAHGFQFQLVALASQLRPDRQTLMFSATFVQEAREVARLFAKDAVQLTVGGEEAHVVRTVKQHVVVVAAPQEKPERCKALLQQLFAEYPTTCRVLVFVNHLSVVDTMASELGRAFPSVVRLHSEMPQRLRMRSLKAFRNNQKVVMVATDLASRGLDIKDVTCVIVYDLPDTIEKYIHCVGRTGRAGQAGVSYAFFQTSRDLPVLAPLLQCLVETGNDPPPEFVRLAQRRAERLEHPKKRKRSHSSGLHRQSWARPRRTQW